MSAVNVIVHADAAHVLTDGAGYKPDGTLVSTQQKAFGFAPINTILTVRGDTIVWPLVAGFMNELHDSFDDVVERFPETYRLCRDRQSADAQARFDQPHEIILAGFSEERNRAEAYCQVNTALHGLPVGVMIDVSKGLLLPGDQDLFDRTDLSDPAFDPERDGLALLEAQRAKGWPLGVDGAPVRAVGGFAQLTTVRREGITSKVLRRWPDRVGEKIGEAA